MPEALHFQLMKLSKVKYLQKTKHVPLVKLLQGAEINAVSKAEVMIIGVLKNVCFNIHSAKHQSA